MGVDGVTHPSYKNLKRAITAKIIIERIRLSIDLLNVEDYKPLYNCGLTRPTALLINNCYS